MAYEAVFAAINLYCDLLTRLQLLLSFGIVLSDIVEHNVWEYQ